MFSTLSVLFSTSVLVHKLKLSDLIYCNDFLLDYSGRGVELLKDAEQRDYVTMPALKKILMLVIALDLDHKHTA